MAVPDVTFEADIDIDSRVFLSMFYSLIYIYQVYCGH